MPRANDAPPTPELDKAREADRDRKILLPFLRWLVEKWDLYDRLPGASYEEVLNRYNPVDADKGTVRSSKLAYHMPSNRSALNVTRADFVYRQLGVLGRNVD